MLLLIGVDFVPKKQGFKKYALIFFRFNDLEIIFILLIKVITFYIQNFII